MEEFNKHDFVNLIDYMFPEAMDKELYWTESPCGKSVIAQAVVYIPTWANEIMLKFIFDEGTKKMSMEKQDE